MDQYLFYTGDGSTAAPDGAAVENYQVLGIEAGSGARQALQVLLENSPWIRTAGYQEIRACRITGPAQIFRI